MRQGHDLRYVFRIFEDDHVMGIETYGSMVFSLMKQIRLFSHRHKTRDTGHIETKKSYLSREETDSIRRYLVCNGHY
jgi:hypothetical protein